MDLGAKVRGVEANVPRVPQLFNRLEVWEIRGLEAYALRVILVGCTLKAEAGCQTQRLSSEPDPGSSR